MSDSWIECWNRDGKIFYKTEEDSNYKIYENYKSDFSNIELNQFIFVENHLEKLLQKISNKF